MIQSLLFRNPDPDPGNTVLLCGSGRSGTTWLAELIQAGNECRYMFEPFWHRHVPACRHFKVRQYLRVENDDPRFLEPANAILTGTIRRWWIDKYNRCYRGDVRLIKDIRTTLLSGWLHGHFPTVRMIYVLRHPAAVTQSRLGREWRARTDEVLDQPDLVADHLAGPLARFGEPRDRFDRHILMWCIENLVPLRQLAPGSVHPVFYEDLCVDPEGTLGALGGATGLDFGAALQRVGRPSRQALHNSAVRRGEDLVTQWQTKLSAAQIDRILECLEAFDLHRLYDAGPLPKVTDPFALFGDSPSR